LQTVVTKARAEKVLVDELATDEAAALLAKWLYAPPSAAEHTLLVDLAQRLGEWALLLELVGAELRSLMEAGRSLADSVDFIVRRFEKRGMTYLNRDDENERSLSISISLDASVSRLKTDVQTRFYELSIFPEDSDIPFDTIGQLWGATANFDDIDSDDALEAMNRLSLFTRYDVQLRIARLHDVVRKVLAERLDDAAVVHTKLLDAWGDLTQLADGYAWRSVAYHLEQAHQLAALRDLLLNFDYLQNKVKATKPIALIIDCDYLTNDYPIQLIQVVLSMSSNILLQDTNQLGPHLYGRLLVHRDKHSDIDSLLNRIDQSQNPYLLPIHQTMLAADSSLINTIDTSDEIYTFCLSDDGTIVATGHIGAIKVWNARTGLLLHHMDDYMVDLLAIEGDFLISASSHSSVLHVWAWKTGELIGILSGHTDSIKALAVYNDLAISVSQDNTARIWNYRLGLTLNILHNFQMAINNLAIDDNTVVFVFEDGTIFRQNWRKSEILPTVNLSNYKGTSVIEDIIVCANESDLQFWNWHKGEVITTLHRPSDGYSITIKNVAIINDSVAISFGHDNAIEIWNWRDGQFIRQLQSVYNIEHIVGSSANILASTSGSLINVWDIKQERPLQQIEDAHRQYVKELIVQSEFVVSASYHGQGIRVWNWQTGKVSKWFKDFYGYLAAFAGYNNFILAAWREEEGYSGNGITLIDCKSLDERGIGSSTGPKINHVAIYENYGFVTRSGRPIKIIDLNTEEVVQSFEVPSLDVLCVHNKLLFIGIENGIEIWNWQTEELANAYREHRGFVRFIIIATDEVAVSATQNSIHAWNWQTGEKISMFGQDIEEITSLTVREDIAVVCSKGTLRFYHWQSGYNIFNVTLYPLVTCCAFTEAQDILIVGDASGQIHAFRFNESLQILMNYPAASDTVGEL
jgi:WD40 repeat protein